MSIHFQTTFQEGQVAEEILGETTALGAAHQLSRTKADEYIPILIGAPGGQVIQIYRAESIVMLHD